MVQLKTLTLAIALSVSISSVKAEWFSCLKKGGGCRLAGFDAGSANDQLQYGCCDGFGYRCGLINLGRRGPYFKTAESWCISKGGILDYGDLQCKNIKWC
ncbi:MAG: hypothetical protein BYD32DRAFT_430846 [Podila humilis]|nr:MAG: hypothetical protein BYD32DRAFT_430846 [Podila humilis]